VLVALALTLALPESDEAPEMGSNVEPPTSVTVVVPLTLLLPLLCAEALEVMLDTGGLVEDWAATSEAKRARGSTETNIMGCVGVRKRAIRWPPVSTKG
jgi:hypothetical protein